MRRSGEIMASMKNYDGAVVEFKKAVEMALREEKVKVLRAIAEKSAPPGGCRRVARSSPAARSRPA